MENNLRLLPRYFKLIGLGIVIVCLIIRYSGISILSQYGLYAPSALIFGIVIIAFSRNKGEDELMVLLRLKALAGAFMVGMFEVILAPVFDHKFNVNELGGSGGKLVFKMLIMYFVFFYILRRKHNNG